MRTLFLSLTLVALVTLTGSVAAQSKNGSVRGVVRDEARNTMPGVQIVLSNMEKKDEVRTIITTERGEYSFQAPPGRYEVKAVLPGFQTVILPDVQIKENETTSVDVTLSISGRPQRGPQQN